MPLIDLTRQAAAASTASVTLQTTAAKNSTTGLYDVTWASIGLDVIGTGNLNIGTGNTLTAGYLKLLDNQISDSAGNTSIILLPSGSAGGVSGSVHISGDLIVEGSASYQNVNTIAVEDPIMDLNFSGSTALTSVDSGIRVGRSGGTNAQLVFDHSETRWAIDNAAGSNVNIVGVSTTDTLTNKTITSLASSTMASAGNLTFSGGGEVRGLPSSASLATSATSKTYVEARDNYLRKQFVKNTSSITVPSTASFTAVTASAPSGMTSTTENDFVFFINGQYMEHDAITIQQASSTLLLKVDNDSIGYDLESDDEILAIGKFNS